MHGVKRRVKSSQEVETERKNAELEKIQKFRSLQAAFMQKRAAQALDQEVLDITASLLDMNPEFYTLWNYRRQVFQHWHAVRGSVAAVQSDYEHELRYLEQLLMLAPKSYWLWLHRKWVTSRMQCNWQHELRLCAKALSLDERNCMCLSISMFINCCVAYVASTKFHASCMHHLFVCAFLCQ
eukprot:TRINITY_DN1815_c0_g2_i1.p1 TRINITY_DN1815_c0_g2~~TRINITY_DN1815_c0_g2_i1.p1  ORF type:complete len:182 (+),score=13.98 TRINITY_DN1815_c0_g2_i1:156-701(+)